MSTDDKSKSFAFILIPWEEKKPIQTISLDYQQGDDVGGDQLPKHLYTFLDENMYQIEVTPLKRMSPIPSTYNPNHEYNDTQLEQLEKQLIESSGVYAYYCLNSDVNYVFANKRATSLSMTCGLLSQRFYGDVFISRIGYFKNPFKSDETHLQMMNRSILLDEIKYASYVSPDLRKDAILSLLSENHKEGDNEEKMDDNIVFPNWLLEAAKSNYEDKAALSILASTMNKEKSDNIDDDNDDIDDDNGGDDDASNGKNKDDAVVKESKAIDDTKKSIEKVSAPVGTTLCLNCRRPSKHLCPHCEGMYFCELPRQCAQNGWSHQCLCRTWSLYTQRRAELSTFPFKWHVQLMDRQCQLSDKPYESYLINCLGVLPDNNCEDASSTDYTSASWWRTEESGWKGGTSESAKQVGMFNRLSYKDGFALSDDALLPPERSITNDDCVDKDIHRDSQTNFVELNSWGDYYKLRNIPLESPVALLCTFPLTLYYAVQQYGKVPVTVANMLKRPMRIHVVGIEKELNFLDLFKEFGYLLPADFEVEIVFICREDMVPKHCNDQLVSHEKGMKLDLTSNLTLFVQSGTFNDTLHPMFDCGTGPPDMVIGLNAGLYAYESWRNVIEFLHDNRGVVGVFTDYNEHSGMNCASLGGGKSRESLKMNPFRQPRAMPVYSMNLPQFSNGFMYVFNEQELDM